MIWNLRRTNNLLLGAIVLVNLYVVAAPFAPAVVYWWQKNHSAKATQLSQLVNPDATGHTSLSIPATNTVVVPSMLLSTPILEGPVWKEYQTLDKGVWRWPEGSTPDKGGNTILIGHRFTYTNPRGIFYELNKVKMGDVIGIFWNKKEYIYKVSSITVVSPHQTDILNQTKQAEITMYTCTPTWNPIHRLVVVAQLQETRSLGTT